MTDESKRLQVARHVLLSSLSNYIGKFINLGIWFVLTPFVLNQLGETRYGLWALVGSVVAYGFLLDFGITGAVTKYVAEYRAKGEAEMAHSLIATALWMNTGLGLLVVLISVLLAPVFTSVFNISPEEQKTALWLFLLAGIGVGLTIPGGTVTAVLRGLQRFDLINLIGVTATLVSAVATFSVLVLGGGVLGLALVGIGVTILVQLLSSWLIYRIAPELRFGWFGPRRSHMEVLVSYSSSLFFMNLGGYLESRSDEIVIGGFLPISSVTPYNLGRRLSTLPQTFTEQFLTLLLPMASEMHAKEDSTQLRSLYIISTRVTLAIFVSMSMVLVILVKPLLTAWVGVEYASYSYLVVILVVASLIDTSTWPAGFVLQGMARHSPLAGMTIAAGIANLILSILLVQRFGLLGVALGTLLPTTIICLGFVFPYAMRVIGTSVKDMYAKVLWPTLLPLIPMSILLIILREIFRPSSLIMILALGAVGPLVYLAVYLRIGANEFEREIAHKIFTEILFRTGLRFKASERSS
jgi:O-antigen/teichoic acid export membrane protein